eukprot:2124848-Alexandrium_andersonii.AAC.1
MRPRPIINLNIKRRFLAKPASEGAALWDCGAGSSAHRCTARARRASEDEPTAPRDTASRLASHL